MKKTITIILVCVLALSIAIPGYAVNSENIHEENINSSMDANTINMYTLLTEAVLYETQNADSLLEEASFESISFGESISAYSFINNQLISSDTIYIPIFSNNNVICIATVFKNNGTITGVQLSDRIVEEINDYCTKDICLIFTDTKTYIYSENTVSLLKSYNMISNDETEKNAYSMSLSVTALEIANISYTTDNSTVTLKNLSATYSSLAFSKLLPNTTINVKSTYTTYPLSKSLGAAIVRQYSDPICWAAVVASIGLEVTGVAKTASYVSNYIYGELKGGNTADALKALQQIYYLDGTWFNTAPSFSQIKEAIYTDQYPIYVRVYKLDSINHALFIDGYIDYTSGSYDGCLLVGDPNFTSYQRIYFTQNKVYEYELNNKIGKIDQYIYLYR